ncbi:MAG: hypothetical protein JO182_16975 [Acidobacteriaceae bacterium]|nr:hypothetical protein [Acidobacteriaceae bacterium]MBV9223653.1 hypothetical protein [Acidobacteriaceae bacterium]MBV9305361.1 hypothetical protein [Acidobacteriaceae bacterium]
MRTAIAFEGELDLMLLQIVGNLLLEWQAWVFGASGHIEKLQLPVCH